MIWYLKTAETINIIYKKYILSRERETVNALLFLKVNNNILSFIFVLEKYYIQKQEKENSAAGAAIINK